MGRIIKLTAIALSLFCFGIALKSCLVCGKRASAISVHVTTTGCYDSVCLANSHEILNNFCVSKPESLTPTSSTFAMVYETIWGYGPFSPIKPTIPAMKDTLFLVAYKGGRTFASKQKQLGSDEIEAQYDFGLADSTDFYKRPITNREWISEDNIYRPTDRTNTNPHHSYLYDPQGKKLDLPEAQSERCH